MSLDLEKCSFIIQKNKEYADDRHIHYIKARDNFWQVWLSPSVVGESTNKEPQHDILLAEHSIQNCTFSSFSSNKQISLPLSEITQLEQSDLADHSLRLVLNLKKHYNFAFASDSKLYDWQDYIYQRCPLGNYSAPFNFVHKAHVGGDMVSRRHFFHHLFTNLSRTKIYSPSTQKLQEVLLLLPLVYLVRATRPPSSPPPLAALTIATVPSPHQL